MVHIGAPHNYIWYLFFPAELLVDKAMDLRYIGGHFGGNIKPTPFLCLVLKMLQIQPDKEIIVEFIRNDHKWVYANDNGQYVSTGQVVS